MKQHLTLSTLLSMSLLLPCCKQEDPKEAGTSNSLSAEPVTLTNQLADAPSPFLAAAADSPVHWQTWGPSTLETAGRARKMIFALVGSTRYAGCYESLQTIDRSPDLVRRLNEEFVPVLVDLDLTRETGFIAYALSPETGRGVSFPFLILISPEGSPVTWQPLQYQSDASIEEFFDNSVEVVSRLWQESPDYVMKDSREKLHLRRDRLPPPDPVVDNSNERQEIAQKAARRLVSFYDADIATLSGAGGLLPVGLFDSLLAFYHDPTLPKDLRERCRETLNGFSNTLLKTAMFDPLDGGAYTSRRGPSWNLPVFSRDASTQARTARALAGIYQFNQSPDALRAAIDAVRFAESSYRTAEGFFSLTGAPGPTPTTEWLWTLEQVESTLDDEEFLIWKALSDLDGLGNLPSEADPTRIYFRLNSLSRRHSPDALAEELGMNHNLIDQRIASGRKKLLKARENRFPAPRREDTPSASASFRMASAYAALFTATGDEAWRKVAVSLADASRRRFCASRFINERPDAPPEGMSDGRAFTYAVAIQAAMDLGAITLNDDWNLWAQDMITLLGEHFVTEEGRLIEVRSISKVIDLDFEDRVMVFDDSTAGLVRLTNARLRALGFDIPPTLAAWSSTVPNVVEIPIVFTDTLRSMSHEWSHYAIKVGPDAPDDLKNAVERLPIDHFERRLDPTIGSKIQARTPSGETLELTDLATIRALAAVPQ